MCSLLEADEQLLEQVEQEYNGIMERIHSYECGVDLDGKRIVAELEELMRRLADYVLQEHESVRERIGG